jgi:hypothetical protein
VNATIGIAEIGSDAPPLLNVGVWTSGHRGPGSEQPIAPWSGRMARQRQPMREANTLLGSEIDGLSKSENTPKRYGGRGV